LVVLDEDDFEISDILTEYLEDSLTRPVFTESSISASKVAILDGEPYSLTISLPFTKTFTNTIGPMTCDETSLTLEVLDHDGVEVDSLSDPWSYDGLVEVTF